MKKIPFKAIAAAGLALAFLVGARCLVTVGKCRYYGQDWQQKLADDAWVPVGIVALAVGLGAVAGWIVQKVMDKK